MTYGEFKNIVLKLLNKYSARGTELTASKTADIRLKIQDFINAELMDLASTTGKLPAKKVYIQSPVCNDASHDTSTIKQHLPGVDYAVKLAGAKAYFFEATGPATVTIDEETAEGVWNTLVAIAVDESVNDFVEFKGLITASDSTNLIRINFSGSYIYSFKNYILYPYAFPSAELVQQHRPRFTYVLPADFLKINNLIRRVCRQEVEDKTYILDMAKEQLGINRYNEGEYVLNYWRKPTYVSITGSDAIDDDQIIDVNDDGAYVLALGVASLVAAKNDPATSVLLNNLYEAKKATLGASYGVYNQASVPLCGW